MYQHRCILDCVERTKIPREKFSRNVLGADHGRSAAKAREFRRSESSSSFSVCDDHVTMGFLFRRGPLRHTWPPYRPSRFWQRPAKMRATTRNAWDSVWSPSHSPCQLFRPQRWVKLEWKEHDRVRPRGFNLSASCSACRGLRFVLLTAKFFISTETVSSKMKTFQGFCFPFQIINLATRKEITTQRPQR